MRPDILLFERGSGDTLPIALQDLEHIQNRRRYKVHVVEVGFCTELAYAEKFKEKHEQHCTLLEHLRNAGYADVQLHVLIFGSTGGMFSLTALHLTRLGVSHSTTNSLLQDMHWKALKRLEQIVGTRRRLEHEGNGRHEKQGKRNANKRKHGT